MYKLCVYIPEEALEDVKQAMFAAGAGRIGNYDCCSWQVQGEGQFRPLAGSSPSIGRQAQLETVVEYKVELVCEESCLSAVVDALNNAHPYEEPAYQYWVVNSGRA